MESALVCGGGGFIGSHLVRRLKNEGFWVRAVDLKFPEFGEGPLTKARAKLVNRRALAEKGKALDLGAHLIVSRGEAAHGGRERPSAGFCSASTAWWSKATVEPTPTALPMPSMLAMRWPNMISSTRSIKCSNSMVAR